MKYYKLDIIKSSKSRNGKENYGIYDDIEEYFKTIEEVKEYLKENYGTCKRSRTYQDDKKGNSYPSGYVYSFLANDQETGKQYIEEHWINLYIVNQKICDTF